MSEAAGTVNSRAEDKVIGLSVLDVLDRRENVIHVRGMDMLDGTPILDIKPYVDGVDNLPSRDNAPS